MSEEQPVSRRDFMGTAVWAIGGVISAAFAIPAVVYIVGPALQRQQQEEWISLGSVDKVEQGVPTLFKTTIQRQTGWIVNEEEISVYVLTEDLREYAAMSNICTHLGCRVRWVDDRSEFFCPCHNGVFDEEGKVVSGPPPRPLDRYETKVENNQIFIKVS